MNQSDNPNKPTPDACRKKETRKSTGGDEAQPSDKGCHPKERDMLLSREDAKGASPADASVGGEEDAGAGLESVVTKNEK